MKARIVTHKFMPVMSSIEVYTWEVHKMIRSPYLQISSPNSFLVHVE